MNDALKLAQTQLNNYKKLRKPNDLLLELMSSSEVLRWFKPTTETEQILVEKLQESIEYEPVEIARLERKIGELEYKLDACEQDVEDMTNIIDDLQRKLRDKDDEIRKLLDDLQKLK